MTAALLENFDLLAASVGGVARLRELILSLAVRGRVVPQDPNDEPASELLKRIRAEKDRLIEEGKIKRDKPLAAIPEDEKPYALPDGWEWVRLGNLCSYIQRGKGPSYAEKSKFLVVSQKCVRWYGLDLAPARCITPESLTAYDDSRFLLPGDLLWNSTGTGTIGRACLVREEHADRRLVADSHVTVVRSMAVNQTYLWRWIQGPDVQCLIERSASGTTNQIELATSTVLNQLVPLPPLPEQSRIVAKVEELMALCDRLEAEQGHAARVLGHWVDAALDQLAESADADEFRRHWQHLAAHFDTLFTTPESIDRLDATLLQLAVRGKLVPQDPNDEPAGELLKRIRAEKDRLIDEGKIKRDKPLPPVSEDEMPYVLPEGWEWVRLDAIADIGTGTTPSRSTPEYWNPPEVPWVASGETGKPLISKTAESVSSLALQQTSLRLYPVHTLVIALYGQGKTRGQISELLIEAATNQACAAIVPILSSADHKEYIKQYFRKIYDEIREEAAGGAQPNLNVGKIKSTLIPLPPLAEQSRIVAQVEKLLALTASLKTRLTAAQTKQAHLAEALIAEAV